MILRDISKRTLVVEGEKEKDRIMRLKPAKEYYSIEAKQIGEDVWQIEMIYKVGSYYGEGG